jgi:RimJ/RimL family protein N-acetyltransferase
VETDERVRQSDVLAVGESAMTRHDRLNQTSTTAVNLLSVYPDDSIVKGFYRGILYDLLAEREPHYNISHEKMPTYKAHCEYIASKPYKAWYIIQMSKPPYSNLGAIYIGHENNIGLFIFKQYQGRGYGTRAFRSLKLYHRERPLYANINPNNHRSIQFWHSMGFSVDHREEKQIVLRFAPARANSADSAAVASNSVA